MRSATTSDRRDASLAAAADRLVRNVAVLRKAPLEVGDDLRALQEEGAWHLLGATNLATACENALKISAVQGRICLNASMAGLHQDGMRASVLEGRSSVAAAGSIARIVADPALRRSTDRWVQWAETETSAEIRTRVRQRCKDAAVGAPTIRRDVFFTGPQFDRFNEAREELRREARHPLDDSETVNSLVDRFLHGRGGGGSGGATASLKEAASKGASTDGKSSAKRKGRRSRYIPVAERRKVLALFGDRCWVEGCDKTYYLEFAHRKPFRLGGTNFASDFCRLCHEHHSQMDAGLWKPVPSADGTLMVNVRGTIVGRFRRAPPAPP